MSLRPDFRPVNNSRRVYQKWLHAFLLLLSLSAVAHTSQAQGAGAQRALEALEGCKPEERKKGCVNILTKRPLEGDKLAIKAQVRGGRIIWYEYNRKTGQVRRTN